MTRAPRPKGKGKGKALAKAKPARAKPPADARKKLPLWLRIVLVAAGGYVYFLLGSWPQAHAVDAPAPLARSGQQLVFYGPAPGPFLDIEQRCPGKLSAYIDPAADVAVTGTPVDGPVASLDLLNPPGGNVALAIFVKPPVQGARPAPAEVTLERLAGDRSAPVLRLRARNAPLQVDASAPPGGAASPVIFVGKTAAPQPGLRSLRLTVPAGATLRLQLACPVGDADKATRISIGDWPESAEDTSLRVTGMAITSAAGGGADPDTIACGARKWWLTAWRPSPTIRPSDCRPGHLTVSRLAVDSPGDEGLAISMQGMAFTRIAGETHLLPLVAGVTGNKVLDKLLSSAIAAGLGWAGLSFVRKKAD